MFKIKHETAQLKAPVSGCPLRVPLWFLGEPTSAHISYKIRGSSELPVSELGAGEPRPERPVTRSHAL